MMRGLSNTGRIFLGKFVKLQTLKRLLVIFI